MHTIRIFVFALLSIFGAAILASCAATGSSRATGEVIDDASITARVKTALAKDEGLRNAADINVTTYRGTVQLSGFVGSREVASRAAQVASSVQGVQSVRNDLQITTAQSNRPGASTGASSPSSASNPSGR